MHNGMTETSGAVWLEERRRTARDARDTLGPPGKWEELWRFTDLEQFRLDRYSQPTPCSGSLPSPQELEQAQELAGPPASGRVVHVNGLSVELELGREARRAGVIFTSLDHALAAYPDLLEQHLGRLLPADDYYSASSLAGLRGGTLLLVPAGVELSAPLLILNWIASSGIKVPLRNLVIVEPGARIVLDELHLSGPLWEPSLSFPVTELFVGAGASVRHAAWQELGPEGRHLSRLKARVERDARLETLAVTLGGHTSRSWTEVVLAGPGAESRMLGAAFLEGSQHAEQWTVQDHQAPNTSSDLLYAGALNGTSRSVYHGTIRVQPGARGTNAYQSNRNLLLSSGSRANTNPQLEIQNEEVRCTHGATVGPIDPEQVFYLMARGIPRLEAERLLVLGFFDRVIQEGKWSGLEERLAHNIRARLNS